MSLLHNPNPHTSNLWTTTPDETSGPTSHDVEANTFAKATNKIVKANYSSSKPELWEPDPFNGPNSQKLCTFILPCKLNF